MADVKVCDYCKELIDGFFLEVEKRHVRHKPRVTTHCDRVVSATITSMSFGEEVERHYHLNTQCLTGLVTTMTGGSQVD